MNPNIFDFKTKANSIPGKFAVTLWDINKYLWHSHICGGPLSCPSQEEDSLLMETADINVSERSHGEQRRPELKALWGTSPQESMMGKSGFWDSH